MVFIRYLYIASNSFLLSGDERKNITLNPKKMKENLLINDMYRKKLVISNDNPFKNICTFPFKYDLESINKVN
jgi:hypothetical protein